MSSDESCLIEVRVNPRSASPRIEAEEGGVRLWVAGAPSGGEANRQAVAALAAALGLPKSHVTIVRGLSSRNKVFRVQGLDLRRVIARLRGQR